MTSGLRTHRVVSESVDERDLIAARRVLDQESAALSELSRRLDDRFSAALEILAKVRGRVIVGGIGKSGHVAGKIAATLTGTGTPAQFLHPNEASHGDLGMITEDDAVLLLSKSGETGELADILAYAKRFAIPLIAITDNPESTLGRAANVALELPAVAEACPTGLAPTTSTTMMMALGDAIAVALLDRRGVSPAEFRVFHPGGKLGSQLMKVSEIMHDGDELPLVGPDSAMSEVILVITAKRFGCAGVVGADGTLQGVITDGDLRRHMNDGLLNRQAGEVMTGGAKSISPTALASEALAIMNAGSITNLFVVAEGRPVGILHIHDCLAVGVA